MKTKKPKKPKEDLALRIIKDLKLMGQALAVIASNIRNKPELFTCANDFVLMNIMKDRVQNGAIAVAHAISWAHAEKHGRPKSPPLQGPPEFQNCRHCQAQLPYTYPKIHCPKCKGRLHPLNDWAIMMAVGKPKEQKEILADIDATE